MLLFIYRYLRYGYKGKGKIESLDDNKNKTMRVFVTGPSLNNEVASLIETNTDLSESIVVNFFADTELFKTIRPKYYCFVDPVFFKDTYNCNLDEKILKYINAIDWEMSIFVPDYGYEYIKKRVSNNLVKVLWVPTIQYEGGENLRFNLYRKNLAGPSFVNVSIFALFAMLNAGYKNIELYGADHNYFLKGLCVDDNNEFYLERSHFYGEELMKIVRYTSDGNRWKVSNLMWENYVTFKVHEEMQHYAEYIGAKIVNCTKNSLIDAYTRIAQIEKQTENKDTK